MKGERYFEEHPWDRACSGIRERKLGTVCELAIQIVCKEGELERTFARWLARVEELTGAKPEGETLMAPRVISFVGMAGSCVVRIFVDVSDSETTEDFEIVTDKALIVWKPGTSLQGRSTAGYTCCNQKFVSDLEATSC